MPVQMCSPTDALAGESLSYRWLVSTNPSALDAVDDTALFIVIDRPTSPDFRFQTTTRSSTSGGTPCKASASAADPLPPTSPVSVLSRSASVQSCSSTTSSLSLLVHGGRRGPANASAAAAGARKAGLVGCVARKVVEVCLWVVMKVRKDGATGGRGGGSGGGGRKVKKEKNRSGGGNHYCYYGNRRRRRRRRREVFPAAMDYCCRPRRGVGGVVDAGVERSIHEAVLHCKKSIGKLQ